MLSNFLLQHAVGTLIGLLLCVAPRAEATPLSEALALVNVEALQRAVEDLAKIDPDECGRRRTEWLQRLAAFNPAAVTALQEGVAKGMPQSLSQATRLLALKKEILLSNPLLREFDSVLYIRRKVTHSNLGLPANWEGNSSLPTTGWDHEIASLSLRDPEAPQKILYRPGGGQFVGDLRLHFSSNRLLFSQPGRNGRWQVFELCLRGNTAVELPLIDEPDVDNYDACYLSDGDLIFTSTATFTGVPCVTGASHVSNLYRWQHSTGDIRRLTFDQEHNWGPVMLNDGRIMYTRWEYSDLPHFAARLVFTMNPDGTSQAEHYGSGSYWPNSVFYAQPIPGHPTMFAGIVTGHHGVCRMGELVLFDPARGRFEADGAVQRIPGFGMPVKPIIRDQLVDDSWPKMLHPCPLSTSYFLVSAQPTPQSAWGLYLVDVFDNLLLLKQEPGAVLFEPIALQARPLPPIIPSRIRPDDKSATLSVTDVYSGPALRAVPRGTVKQLRLFTYQFAYRGMGGQVNRVGLDGPWDIKRVLGTVPVEPDGSAFFRVPANTPISLQPLDDHGRALARMRSWTTAMPGEYQTCGGCHEPQNTVPAGHIPSARLRGPNDIQPWYGPTRGFSFNREVQPVLDRYCVGCHNGHSQAKPDLTMRPPDEDEVLDQTYRQGSRFPPAYRALRAFVRSGPAESDMHLLPPGEFHASTTELVQLLEQGHYGVRLDTEAWDRLNTWIDLGTPAHGTWREIVGEKAVEHQRQRRLAMLVKYAHQNEDAEIIQPTLAASPTPIIPIPPSPETLSHTPPDVPGWPFDAAEASRRQAKGQPIVRSLDLGQGVRLEMVWIPTGTFIMGDGQKRPFRQVNIDQPFWMGRCEISNEQFGCFDPQHDSRLEHADFLHFSPEQRGYPLNQPRQPVCRVSWNQARDFCAWISAKTGQRFGLPSEEQWEYACRAGTSTTLWYGPVEIPFQDFANLADANFRRTKPAYQDPKGRPLIVPEWRPAVISVNDGYRVASPIGTFKPNAWGLQDMHGNVWEWTRSAFAATNETERDDRRAVRGGSWSDRPARATASARWGYHPWQVVYNVGFRVISQD